MPDQEVLINDSNLNAIANAIRRKNGLVRTYKPREMAPAIRAINADAPDSREYTVTVIQTPHQTIKVRQVLGGEKQYDQSFTVSEPYWKIQATIEPEVGYTAGALNYPNEVTVDRDITIKATPATEIVVPPDTITNLYLLHIYSGIGASDCGWLGLTPDYSPSYSQEGGFNRGYSVIPKPQSRNIYYVYCPLENGIPSHIGCLFTVHPHKYQRLVDATDVVFDFQNKQGLVSIGHDRGLFEGEQWVENVAFNNWYTQDIEVLSKLIYGLPRLKSIGDISHWDMRSLITTVNLVQSSQYMQSLDLSGWNTPNLQTAINIFSGGRILDISNWDTTNISNFSAGISAKTKVGVLYPAYLIMDKEEVK